MDDWRRGLKLEDRADSGGVERPERVGEGHDEGEVDGRLPSTSWRGLGPEREVGLATVTVAADIAVRTGGSSRDMYRPDN